MSKAYLSFCSIFSGEVENWAKDMAKKVAAYPAAEITADTGLLPCRFMPVVRTLASGYDDWWPISDMRELAVALAELEEAGVMHDPQRKTKLGYRREMQATL